MRFKHKLWAGKLIALLLAIIALVVLTASGCAPGTTLPKGWSGGVVTGNTLFVCSMSGDVVAVDITSGARLWVTPLETSKPTSGGFGCAAPGTTVAVYGTPAVSGNLVYAGSYVQQGNNSRGKVYAYSLGRSEPRWVYPREGYLEGPIVGGLVAAQDRVYFGSSDGKVYALDAADGYKLEEFQTGDKIWSTPVVDGNTVYIGSFDKKLYALDAASLRPTGWKEFLAGGAIVATPIVYDGTVYIGSLDRYLYAIDATSGKEKGKFMAEGWFWARPVAHSNTIYAAGLNNKVYILTSGTLVQKAAPIDLGSPIYSSPVLVADSVVIATEQGEIYSLDTSTNKEKKLVTLEERVYAPLVASQNNVYVHTEKDNVYVVDVQTGVVRKFQIK